MMERQILDNPFKADRKERGEQERVKMRELANSLLGFEPFVEWAGDLMVRVGFFGEGRELTPYQQGARGKVVQEIERLCEFSDSGADFLARVFREKVCKGKKHGKDKS